jgi:integrase
MRSLDTANRREAERRARALEDELRAKRFECPELRPEMIVDELFTRFVAEGDVKVHHWDRSKHLLPFFGPMRIGQITRNDAPRYRKHRHEEHLARTSKRKNAKPLSDATVNRDLSFLRHLLYWAADEGFIPSNPLARIRMVRERRKRRPVMPVSEEVRLLATAAPHLVPIVTLALDTGMRRGELLHQLSEDIDWERRILFVTLSKTPEGEMRPIPLTRRAFELLSKLRKPSGLVFTFRGRAIRNLKTTWAAAVRRAAIPRYRFHDLRHTFNSRLVEVGVIADVRKELMGHSGGGDVHSIYTHVELPLLREAIARLDAWHSAKLRSLPTNGEGKPLPPTSNPEEVSPDEIQPG